MDYYIALDPGLPITPQELAEAWNAEDDCRAVAQASTAPAPGSEFALDPLLLAMLTALGSVALNVVSSALYDLLKKLLLERGARRRIEITSTQRPDGAITLVITMKGE